MKKEKESWTILWVWTVYLPVKEIKWEFYVKVSDFTRCMDSMRKELEKENKKLKEERELLKQCLDQLMFDADVVNVKIHWELWDYVYVRSDKQFKLIVKD